MDATVMTGWQLLLGGAVLTAMGVLTHGNVRVSVSRETTDDDVDRLLAVLPSVVADLRAEVGM